MLKLCYIAITVFKGKLNWPCDLSMNHYLWKTVVKLTTLPHTKVWGKGPSVCWVTYIDKGHLL